MVQGRTGRLGSKRNVSAGRAASFTPVPRGRALRPEGPIIGVQA